MEHFVLRLGGAHQRLGHDVAVVSVKPGPLLEQAKAVAAGQEAMAIRLDAYDGPAGAGGFYAKCGFTERGRVSYRATQLIYYEMLLPLSDVRNAGL